MPLTFKSDNIKKILNGTKTQTRRRGKHQLKLGHVYGIKANWFKKAAAYVRITRKFKERLGDISGEDIQKEGYRNIWEYKAEWIKLHGHWDPDIIVTAYEFELEKGNGRRQTRINNHR